MLVDLEKKLWRFFNSLSPRLHDVLYRKRTVVVFLISGGSALTTDVGILYLCKGIFGMALIPAVAVSFVGGFFVSFLLQKFWTFEDASVDRVHTQASLYFVVAAVNFFLNIILMYFLVEVMHLWYILAKILVSGGIAFVTFFIYKIFIFKRQQ